MLKHRNLRDSRNQKDETKNDLERSTLITGNLVATITTKSPKRY